MAEITLPQLGETVTEGTITKWFKKVGDSVRRDENLIDLINRDVDGETSREESVKLKRILEENAVRSAFLEAVMAATARGAELGRR